MIIVIETASSTAPQARYIASMSNALILLKGNGVYQYKSLKGGENVAVFNDDAISRGIVIAEQHAINAAELVNLTVTNQHWVVVK